MIGQKASNPGLDGDTAKKPKFDKDFIVLSEFSEQVGPVPLVSLCSVMFCEVCMKSCTTVVLWLSVVSGIELAECTEMDENTVRCQGKPLYIPSLFVDKISNYTVRDQ